MLKLFEVKGFKNFENTFKIDFSNARDYKFNPQCIKNGYIKDIIMYGKNSVGKTNFGLAVFDLDPQDSLYTEEKILKMSNYFNESTDNGKLYLNYPMVESFYHMKSIPDDEYINRKFDKNNLTKYKSTVGAECRDGDYRKFAKDKKEMIKVIIQNLDKASNMLELKSLEYYPDLHSILEKQIAQMNVSNEIFVLCTCIFFISDYNKILNCH